MGVHTSVLVAFYHERETFEIVTYSDPRNLKNRRVPAALGQRGFRATCLAYLLESTTLTGRQLYILPTTNYQCPYFPRTGHGKKELAQQPPDLGMPASAFARHK